MNIMSSLQQVMNSIASFVPKAIAFLVILLIGWIVAKILRKVITKLLAKVGLDRVAERGGINRYTGDNTMSGLTGTLVYFAVLLFTLQFAFNVFGSNPVSSLLNSLVAWLPQLFIAGVIMVVAFAIANTVFELVSNSLSGMSYGKPMGRVAQWMIVAIAAIAALNQIGIANAVTTPVLVAGLAMIAGVVIVGVGGGLISPMRSRWERMLGQAESEASNLRGRRSASTQQASEFGQPAYSSSRYGEDVDTQSTAPGATAGQRQSGQPGQSEQTHSQYGDHGQHGQYGNYGQYGQQYYRPE